MKFATWFAGAALALFGAAGAAAQSKPSVEELARYDKPDRAERLLAAAKAEGGELSIYHVHPAIEVLAAEFTKKYGIKVAPWRAGSETVLQRLVSEARGKRFDADILQNNALETEAACREGLLMEVRTPAHAKLVPEALPANRCWAGFAVDVFVAAYNTGKVRKNEVPGSYEELAEQRWKGRLGIESEDHVWFGTLAEMMGERRVHQTFGKIAASSAISVRRGPSVLADLVASGEVPLGLTIPSWAAEQLKAKGAPIELHPIFPLIAQFNAIAVTKRARNPFTALLFYDFVLEEGQKRLHALKYVPASRAFENPMLNLPLRYIDPAEALKNQDKWLKDFERIVVKPKG